MTEQEARIYRRDKYVPDGVVVARHEVRHGDRTYQPGESLPAAFRAEVGDRLLGILWRQKVVDTLEVEGAPEPPKVDRKPARVKGLA